MKEGLTSAFWGRVSNETIIHTAQVQGSILYRLECEFLLKKRDEKKFLTSDEETLQLFA